MCEKGTIGKEYLKCQKYKRVMDGAEPPLKKNVESPQDLVIAGLCGCRFGRNNFKNGKYRKILDFFIDIKSSCYPFEVLLRCFDIVFPRPYRYFLIALKVILSQAQALFIESLRRSHAQLRH